ncbi:protein NRT1/ PTR FAMILY 7.3-like [Iris pallida]|uniref:Protein NRT1/ PTR FAMILY 7.3-like n=1 Tax=Iris pallida TaxID=29817 RepID=A0AAX6DZZ4_IRIPA|nr:protein NRT1/ PTR FAMILY 7.3-like [Iris pallida]
MATSKKSQMKNEGSSSEYTMDGSVDIKGRPASKERTGGWVAGTLVLVNQGLATLAFFGVGVNLVLFLTRVLQQNNADAANNVSKWTGTVYIFSLVGAFLSDSYWGRYKTCAIFQAIFVLGLVLLSLSSYLFLLKPSGCGDETTRCGPHSGAEVVLFYLSIYLVGLGNGGYQPNIATFGADQFDEEQPREARSKVTFFSYFYLALNMGSLFSNTFLVYFEDQGMWALGFWTSAGSAFLALLLFLAGSTHYRHFKPRGNPLPRVCQVIVASFRKGKAHVPSRSEDLYEEDGKKDADNAGRKMLHTDGFKFLDRAATIDPNDKLGLQARPIHRDPWHLCTVTQVEELKCLLRLLPIWLCTILYSVVFTQMASLFVEQGSVMSTSVASFHIPPASMSAFDILSVATFIFFYRRVLHPLASSLRKDPRGLTELQRMGIGLVIAGGGDGLRRGGGDLQAEARVQGVQQHHDQQHAEHPMADTSVCADRRIGSVHVRGPAGVLQRADARRAEDVRQCTVHDVDITRELREQRARVRGDEDHRDGGSAGVDTGEPQQGAHGQVLLPACRADQRGFRGLLGVCKVVQVHQVRRKGRRRRRR